LGRGKSLINNQLEMQLSKGTTKSSILSMEMVIMPQLFHFLKLKVKQYTAFILSAKNNQYYEYKIIPGSMLPY
jgi:hypothetical protein